MRKIGANYTLYAILRDILVANIGNFCDKLVRQISVLALYLCRH